MAREVSFEYAHVAKRSFRYKYRCDYCDLPTDWIHSEISQKAMAVKGTGRLREVEGIMNAPKMFMKMEAQAEVALENSIERVERAIEDYSDVMLIKGEPLLVDEFNRMFLEGSTCPYCGERQLWYPAYSSIPTLMVTARNGAVGFGLIGILAALVSGALIGEVRVPFFALTVAVFALLGCLVGYYIARAKLKEIGAHKSAAGKSIAKIEWEKAGTLGKPAKEKEAKEGQDKEGEAKRMTYDIDALTALCEQIRDKFRLNENRWYVDSGPHIGDLVRGWRDLKPYMPDGKEIVMHVEVNGEMTQALSACSGYDIVFEEGACALLHAIAAELYNKNTNKAYFLQQEVIDFDAVCMQHFIYPARIKSQIKDKPELTRQRLSQCFGMDLPAEPRPYELAFPQIDTDYYVENYGIVPGKTVWISPEARSERPISPVYWNMIANTMRLMGYCVVFNVTKSQNAHFFDGPVITPPLVECVPFADLCGYVISQRSGLCDWLFFSKAKTTILYNSKEYGDQIKSGFADALFENADHITHVYFPETRFAKWFEDYRIAEVATERSERNAEQIFSDGAFGVAERSEFFSYHKHGFKKTAERFFDIKYATALENTRLHLSVRLPYDADKFDITYELRNEYGMVKTMENTYATNVSFQIPQFGNTFVRVTVVLRDEQKKCRFDTRKYDFQAHTYKSFLNPRRNDYAEAMRLYDEVLVADKSFRKKQLAIMTKYAEPAARCAFWDFFSSDSDIFLLADKREMPLLRLLFRDAPSTEVYCDKLVAYESFNFNIDDKTIKFETGNFDSFLITGKSMFVLLQTEKDSALRSKLGALGAKVTYIGDLDFKHLETAERDMRGIVDFEEYVLYLTARKERYNVFISSSDAHTKKSVDGSRNLLKILDILGVSELTYKYRHSFLCVIDGGNVAVEETSEDRELRAEYSFAGNAAKMSSCGYNAKMTASCPIEITINDTQCAVNRRGLNFVVWDKEKNEVADSVCFDTFADGKAYRI